MKKPIQIFFALAVVFALASIIFSIGTAISTTATSITTGSTARQINLELPFSLLSLTAFMLTLLLISIDLLRKK